MRGHPHSCGEDRGTITPLILLFFLIAALLVMGTTTAGSAFLAQRDLQAVCDGAAARAADAVDEPGAYRGSGDRPALPLSDGSVRSAVAEYQAAGYAGDPTLTLAASTDGEQVTVACYRLVQVPFGAVFGQADGLQRRAWSTAQAPFRN